MLTFHTLRANFPPLMRVYKLLLVIFMVGVIQSCYTMLYPPQTLPQTVTTVVSEPAMVSTIGGTGMYGWDPYWEPALPFTSYHRGYGASYYSPYNYYDYHHPHYAPVYVVSETRDPAPARDFNRDEKQGGSRVREMNGSSAPASTGSKSGSQGLRSGMTSGSSGVISPIIPPPVVTPPKKNKTKTPQKMVADPPKKARTRQVKVTQPKPKPVKKQKETQKSDPPSQKRTRVRK